MRDKHITTTLIAIRAHSPCEDGWSKLLQHLGKTKADDEPLRFSTIAASNGIDDALWCLRALPKEYYPLCCLLAADYAERVLHLFEREYPDDKRPRQAIEAARQFARGEIDETAAAAAGDAAWVAAGAAAGDAAGVAAAAAARAAAWVAAAAAAGVAEKAIQVELLNKYFG